MDPNATPSSRPPAREPSGEPSSPGGDLEAAVRALRDGPRTDARASVERAVERRLRAVDRARYGAGSADAESPACEGPTGAGVDGALAEAVWLACALAEPTVVRPVAREALSRSPRPHAPTDERARGALARYAARLASPDAAAVVEAVPRPDGATPPAPPRQRALARAAREAVRARTREAPLDRSAPERHLRLGLDGVAGGDDGAVREAARRLAFEAERDDGAANAGDGPGDRAALYAAALDGLGALGRPTVD